MIILHSDVYLPFCPDCRWVCNSTWLTLSEFWEVWVISAASVFAHVFKKFYSRKIGLGRLDYTCTGGVLLRIEHSLFLTKDKQQGLPPMVIHCVCLQGVSKPPKIGFRIWPRWGGPSTLMCQGMLFCHLLHASPLRLINFLHLQCNIHLLVPLVLDTDTIRESTDASCAGSWRRCCCAAGGLSCWKAQLPAASGLQGPCPAVCSHVPRHKPVPGPCAQACMCCLTWISIPTVWPYVEHCVLRFQ